MASLSDLFPGLPSAGGIVSDVGGFLDSVGGFLFGSGPSDDSIRIGQLVKIVLNGPGVRSMYEAQGATRRQVDIQNDLAGQAHELVARLETAWTGPSNFGAQRSIRSFADVADESSRVLQSNARNIERQVDTFERMRNSIEVMADPPPRKGAFNPDFSGAAKRRIRKYEQQAERNRQRYSSFVDDTNSNKDDLDPGYGDLPEIDYGDGGGGYRPGPWGGGHGGGAGDGIPGYQTPGGPGGWGPGGPGTIGGVPGGVGVGDFDSPDFTPSRYDSTSAANASGAGGAGFGGAGAGGAGMAGGPAMMAGPMSGAGQDAMAAGGASGAGGAGAGGAGAGGAGAGRGGGAGGGRAGGGMMGGGGAGGGRGQGSDDEEHRRKSVLQENDPEGLFGSDELTAPPVIGDDDYE